MSKNPTMEFQNQQLESGKMESLGKLTAGIAHEINNPVAYVLSNIQILKDYCATYVQLLRNNAVQETARAAAIDLDYMLDDTGDLLEESLEGLYKIRNLVAGMALFADLKDTVSEEVDLNELLETTLTLVKNVHKYHCTIMKDLGEIPPIQGFPSMIVQAFTHVFTHSAQAIADRGSLHFRTYKDDQWVVVEVTASGKIPPPETIWNEPRNSGTGLPIAITLIERHEGTFDIKHVVDTRMTITIKFPTNWRGL